MASNLHGFDSVGVWSAARRHVGVWSAEVSHGYSRTTCRGGTPTRFILHVVRRHPTVQWLCVVHEGGAQEARGQSRRVVHSPWVSAHRPRNRRRGWSEIPEAWACRHEGREERCHDKSGSVSEVAL